MDAALREWVRNRADDRCEYCRIRQRHLPLERLWIEHIVPRQHGGDDGVQNLAMACARCNRNKGPNLASIDLMTKQIVPLFNPRSQVWHEHFSFQGMWVQGLTACGRVTLELLNMNAPDRLRLRAALLANDELA